MYPTDCTFYLVAADEYANAVAGITRDDPTVLDTYNLDERRNTEEKLLVYLKEHDALSWASLRLHKPVVICKPHYGHVAVVNPLPPLVERKIATVIRHPEDPAELYREATHWTFLFDGKRAVLLVTQELPKLINEESDMLWRDLDALNEHHGRDSAAYRETKRRVDLLTHLWAKVSSAIDEGVAYVIVEAQ